VTNMFQTDGTQVEMLIDVRVPSIPGGPWVWVAHPANGRMLVHADSLTRVPGPLPQEPPDGTVYSNGADAVVRCDDEEDPEGRWYMTGREGFVRWAGVAALLVQDKGWRRYEPVELPSLPWECVDGDGDRLRVRNVPAGVEVSVTCQGLIRMVCIDAATSVQAGHALIGAAAVLSER